LSGACLVFIKFKKLTVHGFYILSDFLINFVLDFINNGWGEIQNPLSTNQTVLLTTRDIYNSLFCVSKVAEILRSLSFFFIRGFDIGVLFVCLFFHLYHSSTAKEPLFSSRFMYGCLNESSMYEWQFVEYSLNDMEWQRGACRMCNSTQGKISFAQYIGTMQKASYT
jgi:hypothetical protein